MDMGADQSIYMLCDIIYTEKGVQLISCKIVTLIMYVNKNWIILRMYWFLFGATLLKSHGQCMFLRDLVI